MDAKWAFKTTAGSEDLATSATTAVTSDYIDLEAVSGYADGGGALYAVGRSKSSTAAAGASFTFTLTDCDTSGGTYVAVGTKTVVLASCVTGKFLFSIPFPMEIRQFVKLTITPAASMTGILTVNAGVATE
jgi:hypothetical protein